MQLLKYIDMKSRVLHRFDTQALVHARSPYIFAVIYFNCCYFAFFYSYKLLVDAVVVMNVEKCHNMQQKQHSKRRSYAYIKNKAKIKTLLDFQFYASIES